MEKFKKYLLIESGRNVGQFVFPHVIMESDSRDDIAGIICDDCELIFRHGFGDGWESSMDICHTGSIRFDESNCNHDHGAWILDEDSVTLWDHADADSFDADICQVWKRWDIVEMPETPPAAARVISFEESNDALETTMTFLVATDAPGARALLALAGNDKMDNYSVTPLYSKADYELNKEQLSSIQSWRCLVKSNFNRAVEAFEILDDVDAMGPICTHLLVGGCNLQRTLTVGDTMLMELNTDADAVGEDAAVQWLLWTLDDPFPVLREQARRRKALEKCPKWDVVYDEEAGGDPDGRNFSGIISDGEDFLFFHAFKSDASDRIERCYLYDSLAGMFDGDELLSYPWTAVNDGILLQSLNAMNRRNAMRGEKDKETCHGDESVLLSVKFKEPSEDD